MRQRPVASHVRSESLWGATRGERADGDAEEDALSAAPAARCPALRAALRVFIGAVRMQAQSTRANIEDLTWAFTEPLLAVVAIAVLVHRGRSDLASYALSASCLMTLAQTGFWVGSDVLSIERRRETLELVVISPAPFWLVLFARVLTICAVGLVGFAEGWLIVNGLFGLTVRVHHPLVLVATLLATLLAATCTSVLMSALFSLARSVRTAQFTMAGPLYILGGVLVPVKLLPRWMQPLSPFVLARLG